MKLTYLAIPTEDAAALRRGSPDHYGLAPERAEHAAGTGTPCRHCLGQVRRGAPYLIAAYRPFAGLNAYTETGPIFICADDCEHGTTDDLPRDMLRGETYILRGYSPDERIIYGTGAVVPKDDIPAGCERILSDDSVAFVHVRFAATNCFQLRVERGV